MTLELWESTPPEIRERWRDISRSLRSTDDPDLLPKALQTCFWYGASATIHSAGPKSEMTLRHLLPSDRVRELLSPANVRGRGGTP
ncbi:MAG TPA: hypothetical protein VEH57_04465 [Thermoplasmata archaeon]|nr:hypothetical protein [Thermoplasmata archaeon]